MARRLRGPDRIEIQKKGLEPGVALSESLRKSNIVLTVTSRDIPCAMFGCHRIPNRSGLVYGAIWLLGSDLFTREKKWIVRYSRRWLGVITAGCNLSGNVVDSCNRTHIRWLEWLGYQFLDEPRMVGGHEFREFVKHHHV